MKSSKPIAPQADATGEQQLVGFIENFNSKSAALIRAMRNVFRKRLPTANELVYDNYNLFVIGYCSTERPSDCLLSMLQARAELGCRSITEPRYPIGMDCFSAAAAKTALSTTSFLPSPRSPLTSSQCTLLWNGSLARGSMPSDQPNGCTYPWIEETA